MIDTATQPGDFTPEVLIFSLQGFNELLVSGRAPLLAPSVSAHLISNRGHGFGERQSFTPESFGTLENLKGARIEKQLTFLTSPDMRGKDRAK